MARRKKERSEPEEMHLNITSLIDVLTILLVFLLKSYSAEPEGNITMSKKIQLPSTMSSLKADEQLTMVTITTDEVLVDNETEVAKIGANWSLSGLAADNPFKIDQLVTALEEVAEKKKFIAKNNPNFEFDGKILIQADKNMPSRVLAAVLFSVGQAGFSKINLLAISELE